MPQDAQPHLARSSAPRPYPSAHALTPDARIPGGTGLQYIHSAQCTVASSRTAAPRAHIAQRALANPTCIRTPHTALNDPGLQYIHEHKTAALLEAAVVCGAILGGAADTDVEALRVYSRRIGLAFQVRGRRRVQVVGG